MTRRHLALLALAVASVAALGVLAASVPPATPGGGPPDGDVEPREKPTTEEPPEPVPFVGTARAVAVVVALALTVVLGVLAVRRALRGDDAAEATTSDDESPDPDLGAVADAAGRAAARIERSDPDAFENEVYHAWRAMTVALGADGDATTTPAEFARTAVAAGLDREDVRELTDLFRAVRYGETEATPHLERRATDLLRRIDRTYGEP